MKFVAVLGLAMVMAVAAEDSECNKMCTKEYKPKCAVFIASFGNECEMNSHACELLKKGLILKHSFDGNATNSESPCPQCSGLCPQNFQPVCGSDGTTYGNRCSLRAASCSSKKWIGVEQEGSCEEE